VVGFAAAAHSGVALETHGAASTKQPDPCAYDRELNQVTITLESTAPSILRLNEDGVLLIDGVVCDSMQPGDVPAEIDVTGTAVSNTLVVEQDGGRIASFLVIDLGAGDDAFYVRGDDSSETYTLLVAGMCADLHARLTSVENVEIDGGGGDDTIEPGSCGGVVVEAAIVPGMPFAVTLRGGPGDDTLTGGDAADALYGEEGDDKLDGGAETDWLIGGADADTCYYTLVGEWYGCDPTLLVDPDHGAPGDRPSASGNGWFPENGSVAISLLSTAGVPSDFGTAEVAEDGQLLGPTLAVPPRPDGSYTIIACQLCTPDGDVAPRHDFMIETLASPSDDSPSQSTRTPSPISPSGRASTISPGPSGVRRGSRVPWLAGIGGVMLVTGLWAARRVRSSRRGRALRVVPVPAPTIVDLDEPWPGGHSLRLVPRPDNGAGDLEEVNGS
jgi:RTX calcium-binding nonapeptide repeat (4 copies)